VFYNHYDVICAHMALCRPGYADANIFILFIRYYAQGYGDIVTWSSFMFSVLQTV